MQNIERDFTGDYFYGLVTKRTVLLIAIFCNVNKRFIERFRSFSVGSKGNCFKIVSAFDNEKAANIM